MTSFIAENKTEYGAGLVCDVLSIAPATCCERMTSRRDPGRLPARVRRGGVFGDSIPRIWYEDFQGLRDREGVPAAWAGGRGGKPSHRGLTGARDGFEAVRGIERKARAAD